MPNDSGGHPPRAKRAVGCSVQLAGRNGSAVRFEALDEKAHAFHLAKTERLMGERCGLVVKDRVRPEFTVTSLESPPLRRAD